MPTHTNSTQVSGPPMPAQQPPGPGMGHVPPGSGHPAPPQTQQFFGAAPAVQQPPAVQPDGRATSGVPVAEPMAGTPPVTSHLHQNGFNGGSVNTVGAAAPTPNQQQPGYVQWFSKYYISNF